PRRLPQPWHPTAPATRACARDGDTLSPLRKRKALAMRQLSTPRPFARAVSALLLLALPGLAVAAGPSRPHPGGTLDTFVSGGKRVTVERFQPARPGKYPVVLLLHGLEGAEVSGPVFRPAARRLAGKGFVVLLVRYFERTGTGPKDALALGKQFQD